jgi:hypothetical protein
MLYAIDKIINAQVEYSNENKNTLSFYSFFEKIKHSA